MTEAATEVELVDLIARLGEKAKRVKIAVGGRGSSKSTGVADIMLALCGAGKRICCTREFQNSIDDSVHENLKIEIQRLGWSDHFEVQANRILSAAGGEIIYKGLARNITSLKSIAGIDYLWIEEGESVSENSLKVLTPSIRSSANSDGETVPEIWITMNRGSKNDAIAKKYLARAESQLAKTGYYEDELMMAVEVNWRDNPWFPPELEMERQDDFKNLTRAEYDHIWEGHYGDIIENAIIEPAWFDACIDAHKVLNFEPLGQEKFAYDPADTGDDKAWAYAHGSVVLDVRSTGEGEIDTATDIAIQECNSLKPDVFTWDADGMGKGLKRQVELGFRGKKVTIEPFYGGAGVDRPDEQSGVTSFGLRDKNNRQSFKNRRAQYYWALRERVYRTYRAVEKGERVTDPDELISFSSEIADLPALRAEICRIPRKPIPSGMLQILSKPEMKTMGIQSPNMADAVMMLMRPVDVIWHEPTNYDNHATAPHLPDSYFE